MNELFDLCENLLIVWSENLGMTYKDLNVWIFVIIEPIIFIIMLVSIISYGIIDAIVINFIDLTIIKRLLIHIPCLPIVAGFSYEVLKILAKYMDKNYIVKLLCVPGLLLQKITTKEPNKNYTTSDLDCVDPTIT